MTKTAVELDFFRMEKENSKTSYAQPKGLFNRQRSFRDIQNAVSKMNPELLKTVIGSSSFIDSNRNAARSSITSYTAPLTIFYNGTVAVFNVPSDKAYDIFRIAGQGIPKEEDPISEATSSTQCEFPMAIDGDFPIARRKSLRRFLAKRQERIIISSPYFCPEKGTLSPL